MEYTDYLYNNSCNKVFTLKKRQHTVSLPLSIFLFIYLVLLKWSTFIWNVAHFKNAFAVIICHIDSSNFADLAGEWEI